MNISNTLYLLTKPNQTPCFQTTRNNYTFSKEIILNENKVRVERLSDLPRMTVKLNKGERLDCMCF